MIAVACFAVSARSQAPPADPRDEAKAAIAAAVAEASDERPKAPHPLLARLDGAWDAEVLAWIPGSPAPLRARGTALNRLELGGSWLRRELRFTAGGTPYEAVASLGWDESARRFASDWRDDAGSGLLAGASESWSDDTMTLVMIESDPAAGPAPVRRWRLELTGPGAHVLKVFDLLPDGSEVPVLEVRATRR
jgi:hypothetical protein